MASIREIAQAEKSSSLRDLEARYGASSGRQLVAAYKIRDKYKQLGEIFSPLGLPIDEQLNAQPVPTLKSAGDGYNSTFRGGTIQLNNVDDVAVVDSQNKVKVWFVGLECQVRQEGEDEIFGSVGVIIPFRKQSQPEHFPQGTDYYTMGHDGERIQETQMLVYDDVPADVLLDCYLVEHDSGNIDDIKSAIADALQKAAQLGGEALGIPSEAAAADTGAAKYVTLTLSDIIANALGASDDAYNPRRARVPAKDILVELGIKKGTIQGVTSPFQTRTLTRDDTPGVKLEYNVDPAVVTGTDDGGDTGRYAFYFKVEPYWVDTHL